MKITEKLHTICLGANSRDHNVPDFKMLTSEMLIVGFFGGFGGRRDVREACGNPFSQKACSWRSSCEKTFLFKDSKSND